MSADLAAETGTVILDNQTGLPDEVVEQAVKEEFVEFGAIQRSTFQSWATQGGLFARSKYQVPANVWDEIKLARDMADRDDDVGATMGAMIAVAFSEGMENFHADEDVAATFNRAARHMNLDGAFKRIYREYLIAAQVTTVSLFQRASVEGEPVVAPRIGILPAENVRVLGNDFFGDGQLAFLPDGQLRTWLDEFHNPKTTAARKAEMRQQDPISAVLFTGKVKLPNDRDLLGETIEAYLLNPRMAHRTAMPGDGPYPRPLMTRNFALLEAKRLLNLMDYALLQGGMNFIVVAKKGTDDRPALPEEVANLTQVIRQATRTGVIVGDHRLSFDIITPDLDELLNAEKRKLLGRRISMSLLRIPEHATEAPGQEGMRADVEFLARVITGDRHDLKRHVERHQYEEIRRRNRLDDDDVARIWFPKIILQGAQYFTDYVLKLRDRGDIPRKFAVEAGGFDWEAGVAQRKRELEENIDETMAPAAVPFSNAEAGPQDNNDGRPRGGSPDNGAPGARPGTPRDNVRPLRTINRNAGETVRAVLEDGQAVRVGERTYEILAEYAAQREIGRITPIERRALDDGVPVKDGPTAVVPVNPAYRVRDERAIRLAPGLGIIVGTRRTDGALVAKALSFREPEFDLLAAEETALRWGFPIEGWNELEPDQLRGRVIAVIEDTEGDS